MTAEGFMAALDAWLAWFRAGRISEALGWMTPDEYGCRAAMRCKMYKKSSTIPLSNASPSATTPAKVKSRE